VNPTNQQKQTHERRWLEQQQDRTRIKKKPKGKIRKMPIAPLACRAASRPLAGVAQSQRGVQRVARQAIPCERSSSLLSAATTSATRKFHAANAASRDMTSAARRAANVDFSSAAAKTNEESKEKEIASESKKISPSVLFEKFQERGLGDFFAGVPDSLLKDFCSYVTDTTPEEKHVKKHRPPINFAREPERTRVWSRTLLFYMSDPLKTKNKKPGYRGLQ
jgi:hypothetical protein